MFETTLQTFWVDSDPAGIVYFAHFFRFIEAAEENLFRRQDTNRQELLDLEDIWLPRVEAFAKYAKPILAGTAIRIQLDAHFKGLKTVQLNWRVLLAGEDTELAQGYMTVVCVDRKTFKARSLPDSVRAVFELAATPK